MRMQDTIRALEQTVNAQAVVIKDLKDDAAQKRETIAELKLQIAELNDVVEEKRETIAELRLEIAFGGRVQANDV